MDYTDFINRAEELTYLREAFESPEFQLIPIWGRRRVGKTALILKALERNGIYFLASEVTDIENLTRFRQDAARCLNDPSIMDITLDWETLFRQIADKNTIVVIDEFPYLISANPAIPSLFQRIIDLYLKPSATKLILCGSSIRMMESQVLEYKAPLYGRRTGQINLKPLKFKYIRDFFTAYSFDDLVRVYGICGGIPMYLLAFNPKVQFWKNVEEKVLNPISILCSEADFLLKQEFTALATYKSILQEIGFGRTRMEEIRNALGLKKSDISPYLNNLSSIGLINRIVPVTESSAKSRKGIYKIADNYLDFYFKYLLPMKSMIESGESKAVLAFIKNDYDTYLGKVFERVVIEAFLRWSSSQKLKWERVGSWWYKENEIDLVALSSTINRLLCGEIKWSKKPVGKKALEKLIERSNSLHWRTSNRDIEYLMVAREGFTPECKRLMETEGVMYWTKEDLMKILWRE